MLDNGQTRMPFSQRRTICITQRSQEHLQQKIVYLTLILNDFDLDLQMLLHM